MLSWKKEKRDGKLWTFVARTYLGTAVVQEQADGQAILDMWRPTQENIGRGMACSRTWGIAFICTPSRGVEEVTYPPTRAITAGSTYYLTGKPCPQGHMAPRFTSNGGCSTCLNVRVQSGLRGELPPRLCRHCGTEITKRVCPNCQRKRNREWAGKHRAELNARQREAVRECTRFVRRYREENPCTDCGKLFPWYVMEFDHLEGRTRKGDVTLASRV
jgi:hypothetical protein